MGYGTEDSVDRLGLVVPAVAEGIGIVCKGGGGGSSGLLLEEGGHCLFRERHTVGAGEVGGGGHQKGPFERGKGDQGRKGAVMVRTKGEKGGRMW